MNEFNLKKKLKTCFVLNRSNVFFMLLLVGVFCALGLVVSSKLDFASVKCKSKDDCSNSSDFVCIDQECKCKENYFLNHSINACQKRKTISESCSNSAECCCGQKCLSNSSIENVLVFTCQCELAMKFDQTKSICISEFHGF